MTAKIVIASAKRLMRSASCLARSRNRMAEISVPAWPMPIQKTKLVMSNAQPTGLLLPQTPMPVRDQVADQRDEHAQQRRRDRKRHVPGGAAARPLDDARRRLGRPTRNRRRPAHAAGPSRRRPASCRRRWYASHACRPLCVRVPGSDCAIRGQVRRPRLDVQLGQHRRSRARVVRASRDSAASRRPGRRRRSRRSGRPAGRPSRSRRRAIGRAVVLARSIFAAWIRCTQ